MKDVVQLGDSLEKNEPASPNLNYTLHARHLSSFSIKNRATYSFRVDEFNFIVLVLFL